MASAPAFQAGNAGSIPVVRLNDLNSITLVVLFLYSFI